MCRRGPHPAQLLTSYVRSTRGRHYAATVIEAASTVCDIPRDDYLKYIYKLNPFHSLSRSLSLYAAPRNESNPTGQDHVHSVRVITMWVITT